MKRREPDYGIRSIIFMLMAASMWIGCSASTEEERYEIKGEVVFVDKDRRQLTIAHEEIPGYMEAMTMPFQPRDPFWYGVLEVGDSITGTLVVAGERSWLDDIVVVRTSPDPTAPQPPAGLEPEAGTEVPDLPLVDQDGREVTLGELKGRPWLITFIFTRCPLPDYCPLMSRQFAEIHAAIEKDPARYADPVLLTVSIDPEFDTPAVMREYGLIYLGDEIAFRRSRFATGSPGQIRDVAEFFGVVYEPDDDLITHNLKTAIIGADGKLIKLYRGNDWSTDEVLRELARAVSSSS